jgi:Alpha-galactosidases/6-phospho-beta-glucosidases, family 4 of glycosyl hydrolases
MFCHNQPPNIDAFTPPKYLFLSYHTIFINQVKKWAISKFHIIKNSFKKVRENQTNMYLNKTIYKHQKNV